MRGQLAFDKPGVRSVASQQRFRGLGRRYRVASIDVHEYQRDGAFGQQYVARGLVCENRNGAAPCGGRAGHV
jgi:hypothetical protein